MCLQTLFYSDEIKKNENSKPSVSVSAAEKKMAETLVKTLSAHFAPQKFKDNYQLALKKLIQSKLKGTEDRAAKRTNPRN
jgi:DNA end-binding protein Ku